MADEGVDKSKQLATVPHDEDGFKRVIRRVYEIAEQYYGNDIQNFAQQIYNRLSDEDQSTFLKGLIPHLFEKEEPPSDIAVMVNGEPVKFDIEMFNKVELIKLKSWLVKCIITVCAVGFAITAVILLIKALNPHEGHGGGAEGPLEEIDRFFETLFDL
jgi:hypothetical protein